MLLERLGEQLRKMEFLSPTSLKLYETNRLEFYRTYLADVKSERVPQTRPMSIGSAFDAYVKSELVGKVFGSATGRFDFTTLFEAQVEPVNRDWALVEGRRAFDRYVSLGCFGELVAEIIQSPVAPRFEFTASGRVGGGVEPELNGASSALVGGVPLLGKPDLAFKSRCGTDVILDWKVNGYCSATAPSPMAGYKSCRGGSRDYGLPHKKWSPGQFGDGGLVFNTAVYLEDVNVDWATQLTIYGWIAGAGIGADLIVAIDQLCGYDVRVASHRLLIGNNFKAGVLERATAAWTRICSGWIFDDMTEEQSLAQQAILDRGLAAETAADRWFNDNMRSR